MVASTLALGLLLGAAPGTASAEIVRSVRIEAPRPERFARYLDQLRPGEPPEPPAVRHAVELLYATGEFEDVVVEVERQEGGLDVVFRPRPAPRLNDIRVEGDRLMQPREVRRIARLRRGEPLWPLRLERAGRDVALAQVAKGYLEVQVAAEAAPAADPFAGADAIFRVRVGPRVRVGAAVIQPTAGGEATLLKDLVRPRAGEFYRKQEAERAAQAMRKRLVAAGRWRAEVKLEESYDPSAARMSLVFDVSAGPWTRVELRGAGVPAGLRTAVESLLRDGAVKPDVLEEANDRIEEEFRRRGHRDVVVRHHEEPRPTGLTIVYDIEGGPEATVASVRVVGDDGALGTAGLATQPGLPLEERKIDEDLRTLSRLLEERGHAEARVEAEVPKGGGFVPVVFRARPGPRTTVQEVTVDAPALLPGQRGLHELSLRAGAPYRLRDLAADREGLLADYRNAGFLKAEVTPETTFSEDRAEARIRLRVVPGPQTVVDHIVVAGLDRTRPVVVRREMLVEEGEPLGLQKLLESQRRLGTLGIFDRVNISELDPEAERRSLVVSLAEARRTTLAYGIGYGERDLVRGSIEVTRRNLFGMERTLSAFARGSFRASRVLLSYREPYLFGRKQELFLTVFREEEDRTSFNFIRLGGFTQTARVLSPRLSLIVRYAFQDNRVFDIKVPQDEIDREFQAYTASGPSLSFVNDTRDNPLDPHRGRFVGTDVELSLRALGGDPFVKAYVQAATYRRLKERVLLALSGRLGLARTIGRPAPLLLPLPERFFAGGAYSLRGFDTDKAGPLAVGSNAQLLPKGGNALLLGSAELRVDATRFFQVAAFTDLGNVYPLVSDLSLGDVRYAAGVGLRYKSSLGPLRIDWGYKLNRRPGESASHFHFAIGHAF